LPIEEALPALTEALAKHRRVVLEAAPGAGKTTVVPKVLLEAPWLAGKRILMLEPRRIAARAAAEFIARSLGEEVGQRVGYRIRYETRVSAQTRLEVLTEGMLTRMLQSDPLLEDVGLIIFDEFHERHLASDLALALSLDVQAEINPELRLLLMSASLDGERISQWLSAERVQSAGFSHPLELRYQVPRRELSLEANVVRAVLSVISERAGSVLVFMPGKREIERVLDGLSTQLPNDVQALPLHGELKLEQQRAAILPADAGMRKIIVATNVAESSLTVPDVRTVIDTGLMRQQRFDPRSGLSSLKTLMISRSNATQRAGRAARLGPGLAICLWAESTRLEAQPRAEILDADLAPLALELAGWGKQHVRFLDPPPEAKLAQAFELLERLGAIDAERLLSARGRAMLELGSAPRVAAMALAARSGAEKALAALLTAVLEHPSKRAPHQQDWLPELRQVALQVPAKLRPALSNWRRRLRVPEHVALERLDLEQAARLLLNGFPDRIARRLEGSRYALSSGRIASLHGHSDLLGHEWLLLPELSLHAGDALVRSGLKLSEREVRAVFPGRFGERTVCEFDEASGGLRAARLQVFDAIELSRRSIPVELGEASAEALLNHVRARGLSSLPWTPRLHDWRARVALLRQHVDNSAWPDLSDEGLLARLEFWLKPLLMTRSGLQRIGENDLEEALKSMLSYAQRQELEREAPLRLLLPSGQQRALDYSEQGPVLAVKLQELFGLADTPAIARGRVKVTLHLLSPGGRPIQVTQDLRGFWDRTYAEVKKELKGRYPRHPWPDDPWTAQATHRAKPRGT
jgi:ATP-dependent helicase HrpB